MSAHGVRALERGYRRTPQRGTLALLAGALTLNDEQRREFESSAARSVLLGRGAAVTVGPWGDGATVNLPLPLTSFVGRDAELEEIAAVVREHRIVTLTGAAGIGKTQTALHVAADALSDAADRAVCFVALAPIGNPSLVVAAIASALGLQEVPNRALLDTLRVYLKNKALLLILDNCEHVIGEASTAASGLLAGCPRLRILATSREPLKAGCALLWNWSTSERQQASLLVSITPRQPSLWCLQIVRCSSPVQGVLPRATVLSAACLASRWQRLARLRHCCVWGELQKLSRCSEKRSLSLEAWVITGSSVRYCATSERPALRMVTSTRHVTMLGKRYSTMKC
jgi:hypothetical protein